MATKRRTGAAKQLVAYKGKGRVGGVWFLNLVDADGKQFRERLGEDIPALSARGFTREEARRQGWTKTKAEDARRKRAAELRDGDYRRTRGAFADFAEWWVDNVLPVRKKKRSTEYEYRRIAKGPLTEEFGHLRIEQITYELVAAYVAKMTGAKLGARTVHNRLNVLNLLFREAIRRGVVGASANPMPYVERPAPPRRRWRILKPAEVQLAVAEWHTYIEESEGLERELRETCLRLWLFALSTAMRRSELLGLHWRHVALADPEGPHLRVEETFVRDKEDTPKSRASERTLPLGALGAELLAQQLAATRYASGDDVVWAHPATGRRLNVKTHYKPVLLAVLARAGLTRKEAKLGDPDYIRPLHDLRHTSITNEAASGREAVKIQARAGHSSFTTTQLYIDLSGEQLREGIDEAETRMFGSIEKGGLE
jgi:integrase